ncbi:hypothetical protein BC826DRAFT_191744 [Russula brevipes]|nr:hypothetical protein BC826DRAFT_191744 [Russula brevipes]
MEGRREEEREWPALCHTTCVRLPIRRLVLNAVVQCLEIGPPPRSRHGWTPSNDIRGTVVLPVLRMKDEGTREMCIGPLQGDRVMGRSLGSHIIILVSDLRFRPLSKYSMYLASLEQRKTVVRVKRFFLSLFQFFLFRTARSAGGMGVSWSWEMEMRRACRVLKRFRRKNNLRLEIADGLSQNSNFSKGPRLILGGRGHSGVAPRARYRDYGRASKTTPGRIRPDGA